MPTCPSCRSHYPDGTHVCDKDGDNLLPDVAFTGADAELQPGQVVGEYRIEARIGKGGFGTVYRAVHPLIGKAAAVKVLSRQYSANPQMVARFIAEARAVNQIRHRHIVDIFAFGSLDDGRQYFVMELLEGLTLDAYLKQRDRKCLPPDEAIPILRAIGRALDAAHSRGIAHRDLKPENVFLALNDGEVFPKLLDFGIAKLIGEAAGAAGLKTNTGTPIGTPHYMSPEQCRGRDVDQRTDIYSFGVMAHEVLTGQLPFNGGDVMEILMKQVTAAPLPASRVNPKLSPALDAPLMAMLQKDPTLRPRSIGEAVESLAHAARSAGYVVSLAPPPGESGPRITPPIPISASALAEAETLGATPVVNHTFNGTASDSMPSPLRARKRSFVVMGGVALGLAAAIVIAGLRSSSSPVAAASPTSASTGTTTSTSVVETPKRFDEPTAPAPTPPPARAEVTINIESNPPGAAIFRGETQLGSSPAKLSMPSGDAKVPLTVTLAGFEPARIEVDTRGNGTFNVQLRPLAEKRGGARAKGAVQRPASSALATEIPSNPL